MVAPIRPSDQNAAEDDSVELFLCTPGDGIYYHFMINTLGAYCDAKLRDKSFDSGCTEKINDLIDRIKVQFPFNRLNPIPEKTGTDRRDEWP